MRFGLRVGPSAVLFAVMASVRHPTWPASVIEGVAAVLGHTDLGLTGSEIERLLVAIGANDPGPITKWRRLAGALADHQSRTRCSNAAIAFITQAMAPPRYVGKADLFSRRQDDLNEQLVFVGLRVNDEGKVAKGMAAAKTLDEAAQRASSLRAELARRGTHEQVLAWCDVEVLKKDAFHASAEAIKGVMQRVRDLTGVDGDTAKLIDTTLAPGQNGIPMLAINSLGSDSERDEQKGFTNLLKGISSMYRNPTAHDPRARRAVSDAELLELLTTLSMVHRRLDATTRLR